MDQIIMFFISIMSYAIEDEPTNVQIQKTWEKLWNMTLPEYEDKIDLTKEDLKVIANAIDCYTDIIRIDKILNESTTSRK